MSDKMPTNIYIGHVSRSKGRVHVGGCSADNQPDWVKKDPEYTLVHNNPDYHVIKKSDVDGDLLAYWNMILDAVNDLECAEDTTIEQVHNNMPIKKAKETIRNALIAKSDPDKVTIPRNVLERMIIDNSEFDGNQYVSTASKMFDHGFNKAIKDVLNYNEGE